jgi:hypothetical protein
MTSAPRPDADAAVPAVDLLAAAHFDHRIGPCRVFDQRFELATTDAGLAGLLRELYEATIEVSPPGPRADQRAAADRATGPQAPATVYRLLPPRGEQLGVVARDDEVLVTSQRPATLLGRLVWAINRQVIDGTTDRLLLHAGAVDLDGAGVVIPAEMESGKTTLVTGLLDRGFGYLTDEAASVTTELVLEGYAKPLSIDPGSWEVLAHHDPALAAELAPYLERQWQVPAQRIGPVVRRTRLEMIVFRRYEPETPTRLAPVSPGTAVRLVVGSTFVTDREHLALDRLHELAAICGQVPAYELVGDDLAAACDMVVSELARIRSA